MRTLIGIQAVEIRRATDAMAFLFQNVSINHPRPNATVTKEFLYRADVRGFEVDTFGSVQLVRECPSVVWMIEHEPYDVGRRQAKPQVDAKLVGQASNLVRCQRLVDLIDHDT